ncbi:hypothetical protein HBB16_21870 [Pseudonocardia sp. MCCB 268]|nr:hypothetical protein [Pseudonocardia cytotoxica]
MAAYRSRVNPARPRAARAARRCRARSLVRLVRTPRGDPPMNSFAATVDRIPACVRRSPLTRPRTRVLTGDRPTGPLHLGHLVGSDRRTRPPATLSVDVF